MSGVEVAGGELGGEGVERERAEEVAAEAGVDLVEGVAGGFDPGERECCGELCGEIRQGRELEIESIEIDEMNKVEEIA